MNRISVVGCVVALAVLVSGACEQSVPTAPTASMPNETVAPQAPTTADGQGVESGTAAATASLPLTQYITPKVRNVTRTSAVLRWGVNPMGSYTSYYFKWGTNSNTNLMTLKTYPVGIGSGTTPMPVEGYAGSLRPNTLYYFTVVATNAYGTKVHLAPQYFRTLP